MDEVGHYSFRCHIEDRDAEERCAAPAASLLDVLEHDVSIDPFPDRYPTTGQGGPDPASAAEIKEATELLLVAALLQLPPRQRSAVIARDFPELSVATRDRHAARDLRRLYQQPAAASTR